MSEDEDARRERAERLRQQIERLKTPDAESEDTPEMQPGESPKEYIERRAHEIARKSHINNPSDD